LRQLSKRKKSTNQSSIIELSKAFQKLYFDIFCPIILVADFDGDKCGLLEAYTYKSNEMILRTRLWLGVLLVALLLSPTVSAENATKSLNTHNGECKGIWHIIKPFA